MVTGKGEKKRGVGLRGSKKSPDIENRLVKQNVLLVKLIKHEKHPNVSDVLNNVLIIFRKLGFKRFPIGLQKC